MTILSKANFSKAFTLVEMMVVIGVLGILIAMTAFGYRNWQEGLAERQARSDLQMLATAMQNQKNFGSGYPTSIPSSFAANSDTTVTYVGGNANGYCVEARSKKYSTIVYSLESTTSSTAKSGGCGSTYNLATPNPSLSSITASSMSVTWPAVSGATSYVVRYGAASPTTTASCSSSPCTLAGLSASTNYKVNVTANSQYSTKTSATVNATTTAASAPFPGPTSISACAVPSGGYNIGWPTASGVVSSYYLIEGAYETLEDTISVDPYYTSKFVVDLGQGGGGGSYDVTVQYINGSGQYSTPVTQTVTFYASDCYD